jgi:hypothetical protein
MKIITKLFIVLVLMVVMPVSAFAADITITEDTESTVTIGETGQETSSTVTTIYDDEWTDGGSGESLLETLFGPYTPYNADGVASVDWAWIADVVIFIVIIVCLFKILGGVLKRV